MKISSLSEGQLLTCKDGHCIGVYIAQMMPDSGLRYTPWLLISSVNPRGSAPKWTPGAGEVFVYMGQRLSQTTLPDIGISGAKFHEILWKGDVYRIRPIALKRLSRIESKRNNRSTADKKQKSEP